MADKGIGSLSASILFDEIKTRFTGSLDYEPFDATQKWVYKKNTVGTSPVAFLVTSDEFLGNESTGDTLAAGDKILWIAIKHTGYRTKLKEKTNEGVMLNFAGANPEFDGTISNDKNNMFIVPGELLVLKLNGVLQPNLIFGTCALTNGVPSALGTSTVYIQVAAIVEDISA
jgi:hypothetical protein